MVLQTSKKASSLLQGNKWIRHIVLNLEKNGFFPITCQSQKISPWFEVWARNIHRGIFWICFCIDALRTCSWVQQWWNLPQGSPNYTYPQFFCFIFWQCLLPTVHQLQNSCMFEPSKIAHEIIASVTFQSNQNSFVYGSKSKPSFYYGWFGTWILCSIIYGMSSQPYWLWLHHFSRRVLHHQPDQHMICITNSRRFGCVWNCAKNASVRAIWMGWWSSDASVFEAIEDTEWAEQCLGCRARPPRGVGSDTLWLCQNSYWKWPFIVSVRMKNGDFP